jgi:hypothetical protein
MLESLLTGEALWAFAQVVMIDLVLAGDNAVVIGLAAAGLPKDQRNKAIFVGIIAATVLRIAFASVATQLLEILGLLLIGQGQPYRAPEVSRTLGVPVAGVLPDDPDPAGAYHRGTPHPRRSEFARGLAVLVRELAAAPAIAPAAAGGI